MSEVEECRAVLEGAIGETAAKATTHEEGATGATAIEAANTAPEERATGATAIEAAIASVEAHIKVAPEKMPPGATLVGVRLDRNQNRAGARMEAITHDWLATGMAVAIKDGRVVAANNIFGRMTKGAPKVTATHFVVCPSCGRRVLQPLAVWEAKDNARRQGHEIPDKEKGMRVLGQWGNCPCGGKWRVDVEGEKADLSAFADEVLDAYCRIERVPAYLPPAAFTVDKSPASPMPPEWKWVQDAMAGVGRRVAPFQVGDTGSIMLFNPGFWLGWVLDHHETNLFWQERGEERSNPFNPGEVHGL